MFIKIDFKGKENAFYLKRNDKRTKSEYCQITYEDKIHLQNALNILCRHCGFSEVDYGNNYPTSRINSTKIEQSNTQRNHKKESQDQIVKPHKSHNTRSFLSNVKNSLFGTHKHERYNTINDTKRSIAGEASLSVGSYDLCNPKLDPIFYTTPKNTYKQTSTISNNETLTKSKDDRYFLLEDFSSGDANSTKLYHKPMISSYHSDANLNENISPENSNTKTPRRNSVIYFLPIYQYFFNSIWLK